MVRQMSGYPTYQEVAVLPVSLAFELSAGGNPAVCIGQCVQRWKRWVLSGVRDMVESDAFNWPDGGGLDRDASASLTSGLLTLLRTA
jgi:hypothetical protein